MSGDLVKTCSVCGRKPQSLMGTGLCMGKPRSAGIAGSLRHTGVYREDGLCFRSPFRPCAFLRFGASVVILIKLSRVITQNLSVLVSKMGEWEMSLNKKSEGPLGSRRSRHRRTVGSPSLTWGARLSVERRAGLRPAPEAPSAGQRKPTRLPFSPTDVPGPGAGDTVLAAAGLGAAAGSSGPFLSCGGGSCSGGLRRVWNEGAWVPRVGVASAIVNGECRSWFQDLRGGSGCRAGTGVCLALRL